MPYAEVVVWLGAALPAIVVNSALAAPFQDAYLNTILPSAIADAETRIYDDPELDFIATYGVEALAATANLSTVQYSTTLTPVSMTVSNSGAVSPLELMSYEYLSCIYPGTATTGLPLYAALGSQANKTILLGPTPDLAYAINVTGPQSQAALSSTNVQTILTQSHPALFQAALMCYLAGAYKKNWGAQSDDPRMALSWEDHYEKLRKAEVALEARRRTEGVGWSGRGPTVIATPPRQQLGGVG